ncbi:MAG: hypothetical protein M3680_30110 [Myxococcota bacterium]|nr:hypothetical protein [Myxococcota bacterium]
MLPRHPSLSLVLLATLPLGVLACSSSESTATQMISCSTDPDTGVILRCQPAGDDDDRGADTCVDIDEDGDGTPHDETSPVVYSGSAGDGDGDGIADLDDCDTQPGEDDGDPADGDDDDEADLPYNIELARGASVTPILDGFAQQGPQPAAILSITMAGSSWRLTELQAGVAFIVTDADCAHAGNRDVGRDRVVVTWRNSNGETETDHATLRYCGQ